MGTVRHAPALYGFAYRATDSIRPRSRVQRAINRVGMRRCAEYLRSARPDVVCCVHCTTAGTLSDLKAGGETRVPCLAVMTDYDTHAQWVHSHVDAYCVPSDSVRRGFVSYGVRPHRIAVTGLPVARPFRVPYDRAALRRDLGFGTDRPVVLVMAGASAMLSGVPDIVRALVDHPRRPRALIVCGRDARLAARVRTAVAGDADRFRVFGYVHIVEQLMAASDLLITKAGAVTVTEAIVRGLPLVVYRPIPGQEESNTRYLLEHGAALAPRTPNALQSVLDTLLAGPGPLEGMRRAARHLARPDAADRVVDRLLALAQEGPQAVPAAQTLRTIEPAASPVGHSG